jgi:hypothetical protein
MNPLRVILSVAALLLSQGLFAGERVYYSNDFMNLGGSPRAVAMGEAMAADPGDRTAGLYNPAGLVGIGRMTAFLSYAKVFDGLVSLNFAALTYPLDTLRRIGAYLLRSSVDEIWDTRGFSTDEEGRPIFSSSQLRMVDNTDYALGLSYAAAALKSRLRYGATLKLVRRRLEQLTGYGIGLDAGAQYFLKPAIILGITGRNLASTATRYYENDWEVAWPELYPGIAYKRDVPYLYGSIQLTYQTHNLLSSSGVSRGGLGGGVGDENALPAESGLLKDPLGVLTGGSLGLEYAMQERLFLRAGTGETYVYTLGVGLKIAHLAVDFAFLHHLELKESYRFALAWDFN